MRTLIREPIPLPSLSMLRARNVISGCGTGVQILSPGGASKGRTRFQGNYVGTGPTGYERVFNGTGIGVSGAENVLIGGIDAGARNVISGNGTGIGVSDS